VGARAFLEGSWQRRDLAMLFFNGDSPPGFEVMKRRRGHEWVVQNDTLLKLSENSFERLYASILTSLIGEARGKSPRPPTAGRPTRSSTP
jgi:hypothetical protein